jgi:hypothetical protein
MPRWSKRERALVEKFVLERFTKYNLKPSKVRVEKNGRDVTVWCDVPNGAPGKNGTRTWAGDFDALLLEATRAGRAK